MKYRVSSDLGESVDVEANRGYQAIVAVLDDMQGNQFKAEREGGNWYSCSRKIAEEWRDDGPQLDANGNPVWFPTQ